MEAHTKGNVAVGVFQVRRAIIVPGKVALRVGYGATIAVNGFSEVRLTIDDVPKILHHRQLHLHKGGVVAIGTMTHHARRLEM